MATITTHYTCADGRRIRIRGSFASVLTVLKIVWRKKNPETEADALPPGRADTARRRTDHAAPHDAGRNLAAA